MAEEVLDANAAQRRYWNTVAGPRWVAAPGAAQGHGTNRGEGRRSKGGYFH